jgi:hypothetical protein
VLLTAAERLIRPIKVKEFQLEAGRNKPIIQVTASGLSTDASIFGFAGSPTWVQEIRLLARTRQVEMIEGANAKEKVDGLIARLKARGALSDRLPTRPLMRRVCANYGW